MNKQTTKGNKMKQQIKNTDLGKVERLLLQARDISIYLSKAHPNSYAHIMTVQGNLDKALLELFGQTTNANRKETK